MRKINDGLTGTQRYYRRHTERRRIAAQKKYQETNGAYWRQYYAKNKDKYIAARKKYAKEHPNYRRDYSRKYYLIEANRKRLAEMASKPHRRYRNAIRTARARSIEWNIDESDFCELITNRCTYCEGSLPTQGSGLDRINNEKGYLIGNIVPCCTSCNQIRGDNLTFDEMKIAMNAVKAFRLEAILADVKGDLIRPSTFL
jgi:hypothetical protein